MFLIVRYYPLIFLTPLKYTIKLKQLSISCLLIDPGKLNNDTDITELAPIAELARWEKINMKKYIIVAVLLGLASFIGVRIKQTADLANYAAVNHCSWVATGTHYGDDRDWICK